MNKEDLVALGVPEEAAAKTTTNSIPATVFIPVMTLYLQRSNDRPMRPLGSVSPVEFFSNVRVQID